MSSGKVLVIHITHVRMKRKYVSHTVVGWLRPQRRYNDYNASSLTNRNAHFKWCCYTIRSMTIIFKLIKRYANLNERD